MKPNRRKRPAHSAATTTRKHLLQRVVAIVGAFVLALSGMTAAVVYADETGPAFTQDPVGAVMHGWQNLLGGSSRAAEAPVVDAPTFNDWEGYMDASTQLGTANVGRIWTDKSVFTDSVPTADPIENNGSSDFLVALSALSSTSNQVTYTNKPLDIVLVLDLSASMNEAMYEEVYEGDLETGYYAPEYFVLVNGEYQEIEYENRGYWEGYQWGYYTGRNNWHQIDPKDSPTDSHGTQVYVEGEAKLTALKNAVNQFIATTDSENDTMPDDKHRISIVTFSESSRTVIGLTDCDGSSATRLENTVNGLSATGGTRADLGLEEAQSVLNGQGAREDSQKVVIFFTDGQPGYYQFEDAIAGDAVNYARDMKADGVTIFSIGVFDSASNAPVDGDTSNFNKYLHAVSSNYEAATCPVERISWWSGYDWWNNPTYTTDNYGNFAKVNLGDRTPGEEGEDTPQYYYTANSSAGLSEVFENIAQNMSPSSVGVPTEIESGYDMENSGYITFTDVLGPYMQVDPDQDLTILYMNDPTTVEFSGYGQVTMPNKPVEGNSTDGEGHSTANINQIIFTVEQSEDYSKAGDKVTLKIPASLIPLLHFNVTTNNGNTTITNDSEDTFPIRAVYGVKLKDDIKQQLENPDTGMSAYLDEVGSTNEDGTQAYFYSNNWQRPDTADDETALGSTTADFDPSPRNVFYYFQKNTPVYTDEACTQPATRRNLEDNSSLYYKFTYAVPGDEGEDWYAIKIDKSVFDNNTGFYGTNWNGSAGVPGMTDGQIYITQDSPRISRAKDFVKAKDNNETDTATQALAPRWNSTAQADTVYVDLGNNGRIAVEVPGSLSITKAVNVPDNFTDEDAEYYKTVEFTFNIHVDGAKSADGAYTAAIVENGETTPVDGGITFNDNGDATYKLHDGQQLIIYGLSAGAQYSVTEEQQKGYETAKTGDSGSIAANETQQVAFTNTYKIDTPAVVTGSTDLKGTKAIDGRAWIADESYTFAIQELGNAPLPVNDAGETVTTATVNGADGSGEEAQEFNFGNITFTKPGVYSYTIFEDSQNSTIPAGVTPSQARYRVTITVTDNHDGTLSAETKIQQTVDDHGTSLGENWGEPGTADFKNFYSVDEVTANIVAQKKVDDQVGSDFSIENGAYQFVLTPAGDNAATAPMPEGATGEGADRQATMTNAGRTAMFGIKFDNDAFPEGSNTAEFWYAITENAEFNPVPGMQYSDQTYYAKVTISRAEEGGEATIDWQVAYYTELNGTEPVQDGAVFTNVYKPTETSTTGEFAIHGTKTVDGRDWNGDAYTFEIAEAANHENQAGVTMPTNTQVTVSDTDNDKTEDVAYRFNFEAIEFSRVGTYHFTITETGDFAENNGMDYDTHETDVTVRVEVNEEGDALEITSIVYNNKGVTGASTEQAEYTNKYRTSFDFGDGDNGGIQVEKKLTGRDLQGAEFGFTITGVASDSVTAEEAEARLDQTDKLFTNNLSTPNKLLLGEGMEFTQDDAGKTFSYIVDELSTQDEIDAASASRVTMRPNVEYDKSSYRVDLSVVDDGQGKIHVEVEIAPCNADGNVTGEATFTGSTAEDGYTLPTVTFNNEYEPDPATYDMSANPTLYKVISGRDWLSADSFTFEIAADNEIEGNLAANAMPNPATVTLSGADHEGVKSEQSVPFGFGTLTFNEPGTYQYKVTEQKAGTTENGMTYSKNVATLTFEVKDNPNTGDLEIVNTTVAKNPTFTNVYEADVDYTAAGGLNIKKTLENHVLAEGQFTFEVDYQGTDADGSVEGAGESEVKNPVPTSGTNVAEWNIAENLMFDEDDAGKTITLTVTERNDGAEGYTYDDTQYTVTITPSDNGDGTMSVHTVVTKEGVEDPIFDVTTSEKDPKTAVLEFTNTYGADAVTDDVSANVTATKTLTGRNMEAGEFNFEIMTADADANDDVECTPESVATGTNAAADNGVAGGIDFEFDPTSAMTYTIEKLDQAVTDGYATKVVGDDNNATWTLHYTVQEQMEGMPTGVVPTKDTATSFDFTVTVKDDGEGKLTAEVTLPKGGIAFKNTYTPTDVTVGDDVTAITVQKTFTGRPSDEWLDTDSFEFTIAADESTPDAPLPDPATVTVTKDSTQVEGVDGAFSAIFGDITYNKEMLGDEMTKDFVYIIAETAPADSGDGITKDTHTAKVTVTVTDNGEGQLKAEVKYDNEAAKTDADKAVGNAAAFTNTYKAGDATLDGETAFAASKTLTGRDWQDGEQVDIVLAAGANTPKPDGAIDGNTGWSLRHPVSSNGEFGFPDITYSYDVLGGAKSKTFKYYIFEDKTSHEIDGGTGEENDQIKQGMNYSGAVYRIDVTVTDNGEGGLDVTSVMTQEINDSGNKTEASATVAAFENKFSADSVALDLRVQKQYSDSTGGKPLADGMFTFRVRPVGDNAADAPMDEDSGRLEGTGADRYITADLVTAGDTAGASFGTAEFEFDGQNHTFYYEVTEDRPADATEANGYKSDGVKYDPTVYTVVLDVEYDVDAQKTKATMSYYVGAYEEIKEDIADGSAQKANALVFENSYGTDGTTVDSSTATDATFYKVIDGRDWLESDSFDFTITPNGDAPAFKDTEGNDVTEVTVTKDNPTAQLTDPDREARSFNFGSVTFTDKDMESAEVNAETGLLTKEFTYTVKENAGKIAGMTYDGREAKLTITVTDDGKGNMTATPQVSDGVFTNKYATSVDGTAFGGFAIEKTLTGRDMTEGQFEFTVEPGDDASAEKLGITDENGTVPSPAANDGDTVTVHTFGLAESMEFTQADDGKTFTYEVSETKTGDAGYTYDESVYTVSISVEDDPATATLTVTTTVTKDGQQVGDPIVVTNAYTEAQTATVSFENSYYASTETEGGASATVSTTKTLVNRPLEAGEFTFQVAYTGGDKAVVKSDVTNSAGDDSIESTGTVDFGTFEYDTETLAQMVEDGYAQKVVDPDTGNATWTIGYTATEDLEGLADNGVTPTRGQFDFTITVVDNGNGTLTATANLDENDTFVNTYSTGDPLPIQLRGRKSFDFAEGLTPNYDELVGKYTFTLEALTEGAPMPENNVATNDSTGSVIFDEMTISLDEFNAAYAAQNGTDTAEIDTLEVGGYARSVTFEYQVTESGGVSYVTNDPTSTRTFKVVVRENGDGTMVAFLYDETGTTINTNQFEFTNTYTVEPELSSPTGEGQLTITKTLTGRSMDEGEFAFVLKAVDSDWWTAPTNPAAGDGEAATITFGEIEFDAPGIYKYTLQEQAGPNNVGIEYDASVYNVTATVEDTGTGNLEVTWCINGTTDKTIAFENTYTADPTSASFGASKVLTGRDLTEGEFTFQVTDESGEKVYATATNDANGTVNFEPLTFNQAGTYHLWVSEVLPEDDDAKTDGIQSERVTYDETRYELVVTVEDNRKGNLEVTDIAGDAPVFTNVYTEPEKPVEPQKPVDDGGDKLTGTGDSTMTIVGAVAAAGALFVAGGFVASRKRGE